MKRSYNSRSRIINLNIRNNLLITNRQFRHKVNKYTKLNTKKDEKSITNYSFISKNKLKKGNDVKMTRQADKSSLSSGNVFVEAN